MQFKVAVLLALAGLSAATSVNELLGELPRCSVGCFLQSADAVGCLGIDYACQCSKQTQINALVQSCLRNTCNDEQVQKINKISNKICKAVKAGGGSPAHFEPAAVVTPAPQQQAALQKRDLLWHRAASASGSSVASSIGSSIPSPTTSPKPVTTAGAAAYGVPVVAAVLAAGVAGAALL